MTDALARSLRIRAYGRDIRDAGRTFLLAPGADLRAALKRAALAAVPKTPGWTLRLFTLERTAEGEQVAAVLDRLARQEMGAGFAAALAATRDGGSAVLAVAARDAAKAERIRAALGG